MLKAISPPSTPAFALRFRPNTRFGMDKQSQEEVIYPYTKGGFITSAVDMSNVPTKHGSPGSCNTFDANNTHNLPIEQFFEKQLKQQTRKAGRGISTDQLEFLKMIFVHYDQENGSQKPIDSSAQEKERSCVLSRFLKDFKKNYNKANGEMAFESKLETLKWKEKNILDHMGKYRNFRLDDYKIEAATDMLSNTFISVDQFLKN